MGILGGERCRCARAVEQIRCRNGPDSVPGGILGKAQVRTRRCRQGTASTVPLKTSFRRVVSRNETRPAFQVEEGLLLSGGPLVLGPVKSLKSRR